MERAARASRLARMEMPLRHIWAGLPFKMKLMLFHVQRAERERQAANAVAAVPEAQAPIVIEPIAHRRVS
jgi:hypothetical protein